MFQGIIFRLLLQNVDDLFVVCVVTNAVNDWKRKLAFSEIFAKPLVVGVLDSC